MICLLRALSNCFSFFFRRRAFDLSTFLSGKIIRKNEERAFHFFVLLPRSSLILLLGWTSPKFINPNTHTHLFILLLP